MGERERRHGPQRQRPREGPEEGAEQRPASRVARVALGARKHGSVAAGSAEHRAPSHGAGLDVDLERGLEGMRPHAPVGDRDERVHLSVKGGRDRKRDGPDRGAVGRAPRRP
jgi:hypothetical protein